MTRLLLWLTLACAGAVGPALGDLLSPAQQAIKEQEDFYEEYRLQLQASLEMLDKPDNDKLSANQRHKGKGRSTKAKNNDEGRGRDNSVDREAGVGAGGGRGNNSAGAGEGGGAGGEAARPGWVSTTRCTVGHEHGRETDDGQHFSSSPDAANAAGATDVLGANKTEAEGTAAAPTAQPTPPATKQPYVPPKALPPAQLYLDDD